MKVIFTEGSIAHLATLEMHTSPRVGEQVVIDNYSWTVDEVTHFPKSAGINANENCHGWDDDRDADMTVHLTDKE